MDNPLITTVNKNFELAMAKYSSISGQLAEVRRRILGTESEQGNSQQIQTEEKRAENTRSSELLSEQESTFENKSEEKSSLLSPSSEESIGQVANDRTAIQVEPQTSESNATLNTSIKESDSTSESLENMFGELYKNLINKPKNISEKKYESSSDDNSAMEEDDDSMSSSSENDKTIENLFFQEINKTSIDKDSEKFKKKDIIKDIEPKLEESEEMELNDNEDLETTNFGESKVKRGGSTKSSISDSQIPYENIFNSEPLDIMTILEENSNMGEFIKGGIKNVAISKNTLDTEDNIFDLYEDDALSVKTKMSILSKFNKKKKSSKKASSIRQKSHESNINSLINLKSLKSKSIQSDGKKKTVSKVDSKFKKNSYPNAKYQNANKNIKNGINQATKIKNNEKHGQLNRLSKQNATVSRDCLKQVKTKTSRGKTIDNSTYNNTQSKQNQENDIGKSKVKEKNGIKNSSNKSILDKVKNTKNMYNEKTLNKDEIKKVIKTNNLNSTQNAINRNINKFPSKSIQWCNKPESGNYIDEIKEKETEKKNNIILSSAKDILTKIEQQMISEKLKEINNEMKDIKKCNSAEAFSHTISKKVDLKDKFKDKNPKINTGNWKANKTNKVKVIPSRYMSNYAGNMGKGDGNIFFSDKCQLIKSEKNDELQKDGANNNKLLPKKSVIKSIISKNDLPIYENNQIIRKGSSSIEPVCEIQNEMLTTNVDDRKSIHFPFILGRSASKSFNIQANIQQITSLVRMLPKESIQRTLQEENDVASRVSIKASDGKCPACNEKDVLCEGSDFTSKDDPWDNTNGNFVRCTCMFKNTISSKHVLQQLMFQTNSCQYPLSSETSLTQLEESQDENTCKNEPSNLNLVKRHDLTKLLHATQRFVNIL